MVDESDSQYWSVEFFPKRAHQDVTPKVFGKLKPSLRRIYAETIKCFNDRSLVLCTAGLRALLEGVCDDKKLRGRNLREKIDNMQSLLPNRNIIKNLHHFRFTGNQAVHQLEAPTEGDTKLALEVMDDLLNFFYELDYKASRLASIKARTAKVKLGKEATAAEPIEAISQAIEEDPEPG